MEQIPTVKFFRHKYGDELLVDVVSLDHMKPGIRRIPVHRYYFYSLIFITGGDEPVGINEKTVQAVPGTLITSAPGDVWHWVQETALDGYALIFEEEFLLSFFNDPLFLSHFPYLQKDRLTPFYHMEKPLYEKMLTLLREMKEEINERQPIDQHILRAMLYEALMLICRADGVETAPAEPSGSSASRFVEPFRRMAERDFMEHRDISHYADALAISPNYLNKIVKAACGQSVKAYISARTVLEIKNLLDYTSLSVAEISYRLHFDTPTYMTRWFSSQAGITPLAYRKRSNTLAK